MTLIAFMLLIAAAVIGYVMNQQAARAIRDGGERLHSLASFHGSYAALLVVVPCFVFLMLWLMLEGTVIEALLVAGLPDIGYSDLGTGAKQLIVAEIKSIAGGRIFGEPEQWKLDAAERLLSLQATSKWVMLALLLALMAGILFYARRQVSADFRAWQAPRASCTG